MNNKQICLATLFIFAALPTCAWSYDFWVDNQTPQPFSFLHDGVCSNVKFKPFAANSVSKIPTREMCGDNPNNEEKKCFVSFHATVNCHGLYSALAAFNTQKGISSISRLNYYSIDLNGDSFHIKIKRRKDPPA